jgi:hypothetical protein
MVRNGEPQEPESPQSSGLPGDDQQPRIEIIEARIEYEQRLPGGVFRFSWHLLRESRRPQRAAAPKHNLRIIAILVVFFTLIIIGLIAVGPEGVWRETKELLPGLFK